MNQRTDLALNDESEWRYDYDGVGQVTGGKRFWKDGTPVAGQQFEYDFDHIGNRTAARKGGTSAGTLLRESEYEPNLLNQYDSRTDLGYAEVQGIATAGAMVFVNGSYAGVERKGEYFRKELAIDNSTASQYPQVQVQVSDGTNTIITPSGNLFIGKGLEVFEYDADGNLKTDGRWCYEWDAENRLVQMKSLTNGPAESWRQLEFKYDWQGRRIYIKETNLDTAQVVNERIAVFDGANLYAELTSSGTLLQTYIWGQDLSGTLEEAGGVGGLIGVKPAGEPVHFAAYDGNGNVAGLVNGSNGEISASYEYGPFGEPLRVSGPMGKANPIRWSSKYTDDTTQLVYYWHRYYRPRDGTWLSRDPIEELGGINLYGFVKNNPLIYFDPFGLVWYDDFGDWFQENANAAKEAVFESEWVLVATVVGTSIDLANAFAQLPKQIGHLGEAVGTSGSIGDEPIVQPIANLGQGLGTFSVNPSLETAAGALQDISIIVGISATPMPKSATPTPKSATPTPKSATPTPKCPPRVHKNSLKYVGETHVYRIKSPDGSTFRIGESAQGVRKRDGASIRAEQQVRRLQRKTGQMGWRSEIRKTFKTKAEAKAYEEALIKRYRKMYGDEALRPGNKTNH